MAVLTVQQPGLTGAVITAAAADVAGDSFVNDGTIKLTVINGGAAPITVTIPSARECNFGESHSVEVTIAAGATKVIGPFPTAQFGSTVEVSYSDVTTVTVSVVK